MVLLFLQLEIIITSYFVINTEGPQIFNSNSFEQNGMENRVSKKQPSVSLLLVVLKVF